MKTGIRHETTGNSRKAKVFVFAFCAMLFALCSAIEAQQPVKAYRIGYLRAEKPPEVDIEGFRQGLREHGYVEGKNIVVEYRWSDGSEDRLRSLVGELIRLKVDLIVTSAPAATQAAQEATKTTPVIMVLVADPVAFGFVNNLAHPGANITGFAFLLPEISGKRLELLKETVPKLSRVAVLWNASNPYKDTDLKAVEPVADTLKVAVHTFRVREPNGFDDAFKAAAGVRAEGLLTLDDPFTIAHRTRITDLALRHKLPAVYAVRPLVDAGGLMYYGPDRVDQNRRAAIYVDKILKGAKPADLPVEQPRKFELVINLKTANQIGLTIPPSILARADKIMK